MSKEERKMNEKFDRICALCEYSHKISGGEYFVCRKKGVVAPDNVCRKFTLVSKSVQLSAKALRLTRETKIVGYGSAILKQR